MIKILLVEDDRSIISKLTDFLQSEGFGVASVTGQSAALELLRKEPFDLALLDISISDGNGFSLCAAIRAEYSLPVIFLTASADEYSTVAGLELGAVDYIAKPFRPRELVSRIRNALRRTGSTESVLCLGDVTVDTVKGTVARKGKEIFLTALEYRLLLVFLNHRGLVLSRNQLLEAIWDASGEFVNDNTLTVYIKRLREKIEEDPQQPVLIKTVRGLGYRVDAP